MKWLQYVHSTLLSAQVHASLFMCVQMYTVLDALLFEEYLFNDFLQLYNFTYGTSGASPKLYRPVCVQLPLFALQF